MSEIAHQKPWSGVQRITGIAFDAQDHCECGGRLIKQGFDRAQKPVVKCKSCRKKKVVSQPLDSYQERADVVLRNRLILCFQDGLSIREAARALAIDRDVPKRIIDKYAIDMARFACLCGRDIGHFGWCWIRIRRYSPRRVIMIENLKVRWQRGQGIRGGKGPYYFYERKRTRKQAEHVEQRSYQDILTVVDSFILRDWPEETQEEVKQNVLCDILTGLLDVTSLSAGTISDYKRRYYRSLETYRLRSLDAPLNAEGFTLADILEG